jgi:phosphoglycolate phosphatase
MRFQYLAFDIDGTLFSSEGIILDTYAEAVQDYIDRSGSQIIVPSQERIMKEIGKPVKTIFRNLLPELDEVSRDSISDRVLGLLVKKIESGEGSYYTDSKETIQILAESGYKMLACSNGRLPYIDVILRKLGVRDLFLPICTLDNLTKKEKGDILLQYCQDYNISPQSILMIGDRYSDWEAAQKSKSPFAFCKYGHAEENEIPNFEFLLQNVGDLKKILLPG